MTDETLTSPEVGSSGERVETTPSAPNSPPRDIIAERLAQRMKERGSAGEAASGTDFSPSESPERTEVRSNEEGEQPVAPTETPKPRRILNIPGIETPPPPPIENTEERAPSPQPIDEAI